MVLILLLVGRGFLGSNLTKKILAGWLRVLAVLRAFLRGVLEIRVFFDGNFAGEFVVIVWWIVVRRWCLFEL
jgi:hypothetical protein